MADTNLIIYSSIAASHSYTGVTNGAGALSIDGDMNTAQQEGDPSIDGGNANWIKTAVSQHTWNNARTINTITSKIRTYSWATGNDPSQGQISQKIEYTTDGITWTEIVALTVAASYGANTGVHDITTIYTNTPVNISNCKGIRATAYARAYAIDGHTYAAAYIYEIQAYGQPYNDIGLRYYNAGIKKIGVEPVLASKLRIYKAGTVYGIPLVATTDAMASPVRIYDGSAVKSLASVD